MGSRGTRRHDVFLGKPDNDSSFKDALDCVHLRSRVGPDVSWKVWHVSSLQVVVEKGAENGAGDALHLLHAVEVVGARGPK